VFVQFTIGQMLSAAAARFAGKHAVVTPDRTLAIDELDRLSTTFAGHLRARGLAPGDRVTIWMENGWRWMVSYYGALRLGAVVNPCNILLTADEVAFIVQDCGAKAVIVARERSAELRGRTAALLITDGDESADLDFEALPDLPDSDQEPFATLDGADTAAIVYTSGTTGRPKGARLSHSTVVLNTLMTAQMHGRSSHDVVVSALPCTHVYGNIVMNAAVMCGTKLVLLPRFDELTILRAIQAHRATMFEGVPTMYLRLLNFQQFDQFDLSSLRVCTVGGQSMPVAQMEEAERRFGCRLLELWGMTELGGLATTHPHDGPRRLGSIGVPMPLTEVRVTALGSKGGNVPRGEVGELLIRGPLVMQGYFADQSATSAAIDGNGWLHTGDVVRQDAEGYVYLVDRIKEVIVSGGYKVYPAEVERVIAEHPAVAMVAVAGMRDGVMGLVPRAFIVLRGGANCVGQEIIEHCRPQLAAYKIPRAVVFCEDLPKTSTGKILRRALADSNP
jgi:long-chain acyl-CoA synthetase